MFGMSNREFWEEEPQLYWAYRFSFEKKLELEQKQKMEDMKLGCWLQGKANEVAISIALNNGFNKTKKHYPTYQEFFKNEQNDTPAKAELNKRLEGVTDKDEIARIEFEYWARL